MTESTLDKKLNSDDAKKIAGYINTIRTTDLLYKASQHEQNAMLLEHSDKAILALHEEYGINMPELLIVKNRQRLKMMENQEARSTIKFKVL